MSAGKPGIGRTSDRPEESNDGPPPPWNLGMTRMPIMHVSNQSKHVSNAGVQEWVDLPSEVYECFLSLQTGFKSRFNPCSFLLTDAALVHPGHKSLSWLEAAKREEAIQQFKEELLIVARVNDITEDIHDQVGNATSHNNVNKSAVDAFFDFDVS